MKIHRCPVERFQDVEDFTSWIHLGCCNHLRLQKGDGSLSTRQYKTTHAMDTLAVPPMCVGQHLVPVAQD